MPLLSSWLFFGCSWRSLDPTLHFPPSPRQLGEEKSNLTAAEERQKELTASWLKERDVLKSELVEQKKAKEKAEREYRMLKKTKDSLVRKVVVTLQTQDKGGCQSHYLDIRALRGASNIQAQGLCVKLRVTRDIPVLG